MSAEEASSDEDSSSEDEGQQQKKGPSRCGNYLIGDKEVWLPKCVWCHVS